MVSRHASDLAIDASGLRKRFGATQALDGLDLAVPRGEVHGFLGPNGAGKSTTIRVLLGQVRADGGTARMLGLDCWRDAVAAHRRMAYVPGDVTLWPHLTGGQCIDVLSRLQGSPNARRRAELIERFELDPTRRTRAYSKGNRQKVALCAALATDADLLLLDEPTSGLDPLMEDVFQRCVRELALDGRTVLLSSHILAEVEALCDRVSIVRHGRVIAGGSLEQLRAHALTRVSALTSAPVPGLAAVNGLSELAVRTGPDGVRTTFRAGGDALGAAVATVGAARPSSLAVEPPRLDEVFLARYAAEPSDPDGSAAARTAVVS